MAAAASDGTNDKIQKRILEFFKSNGGKLWRTWLMEHYNKDTMAAAKAILYEHYLPTGNTTGARLHGL